MWDAARFYCKEAEKCDKARAYFSAIVVRGCELEALLRIFDVVENRRPEGRCKQLFWLINRAFSRHWIPHDALRYWRKAEHTPVKTCLHEIREARNGVHRHLFERGLVTRRTAANMTFVVHAMYSFLEIKNARNFMKRLHERGGNSKKVTEESPSSLRCLQETTDHSFRCKLPATLSISILVERRDFQ
jgi:hypothetical protein